MGQDRFPPKDRPQATVSRRFCPPWGLPEQGLTVLLPAVTLIGSMERSMQKILVSRCLLGHRVRYDGGAHGPFDLLQQWLDEGRVVALCPEVAGGLPTPRPPAEIPGGQGSAVLDGQLPVLTIDGEDVTAAFVDGAEQVDLGIDGRRVGLPPLQRPFAIQSAAAFAERQREVRDPEAMNAVYRSFREPEVTRKDALGLA